MSNQTYVLRSKEATGNIAWVKDVGFCLVAAVFDGVSDPIPYKLVAFSFYDDTVKMGELAVWDDYGVRVDLMDWEWISSDEIDYCKDKPCHTTGYDIDPISCLWWVDWLESNFVDVSTNASIDRFLPAHPDNFDGCVEFAV